MLNDGEWEEGKRSLDRVITPKDLLHCFQDEKDCVERCAQPKQVFLGQRTGFEKGKKKKKKKDVKVQS